MGKPWLDVSDVLLSPEFNDTELWCTRRAETVNGFGEGSVSSVVTKFSGVVTTPGPNELVRGSDETHFNDTITVITKFRLRSASSEAGQNYQPDIVLYDGDYYLVDKVDDYNRYGAGFIEAQCTLTDYIPKATPA